MIILCLLGTPTLAVASCVFLLCSHVDSWCCSSNSLKFVSGFLLLSKRMMCSLFNSCCRCCCAHASAAWVKYSSDRQEKEVNVTNMKRGLLGCTALVCKQKQPFSQRHRITEDLSVWHWPSAALRVQFSSSSLNITNVWIRAARLKSTSWSARNRESQRCYTMKSIKLFDKSAPA